MNVKITVCNLLLQAKVGCFAWEQAVTQQVVIRVEMSMMLSGNATISETINYDLLREVIRDFLHSHSYELLESLANALLVHVMTTYTTIDECTLSVAKPLALGKFERASVTIKLTRTDLLGC